MLSGPSASDSLLLESIVWERFEGRRARCCGVSVAGVVGIVGIGILKTLVDSFPSSLSSVVFVVVV